MEAQQMYDSQHYISDVPPWLESPGQADNQYLDAQPVGNANYNLDQIDPALWQYQEEQFLNTQGTASSVHGPAEALIIDPRLKSMPQQDTLHRDMMPQPPNNSYRGISSREQEQPGPSPQPFSQVFVVPITDQFPGSETSLDSNSMFCDFPGIAFRSFLPEGVNTPMSASRNLSVSDQGRKRMFDPNTDRPIVMHGPTQPQVYGPFKRKVPGESEHSSSQSTPYASSLSRLATPDMF
ncbi:uncharacterized protein LY89DRAFT_688593 [Mollisia scopiformis]|uniref:Uncharacterized protein n=1 Tax=Mollisia scopiformis TaxID=149040 RepID=A0A194WVY3_MOLSC|nr:uncharacterized protein LY89DRAFT_688593 [Mollisia scopiformis]KUJ12126.1 hypothetical protein LY89DRAFT_688593 [Mollisia scopiformis]